jgi:hypothetical protein
MTVGEESEVADLDKAVRQDMQQEPADKLDRIQGHGFLSVVVCRVPPAERHLAITHSDQASIGNSYAVCIPGQILEDVFRPPKGGSDLDHPFWFPESPKETVESFRPLERLNLSGQAELFTAIGGGEMCEKLTAKHFAQHGAGKKEPFTGVNPGRAIGGKAAGRNETV